MGDRSASAALRQGCGTSGRSLAREAVADAVDRLHVAGLARLRLDLAAQVLDVGVDRPLIRLEGDAVQHVEQLSPREDASRLPGHRGQQLELAGGELYRPAVDGHTHARD